MSKLFNHKTGKWEMLDDGMVDDAMRSGQYTFAQGIEVPVVTPTGELGTVKSEDAQEMFEKGYRWQTPDDRKAWEAGNLEAIKQKHFGDKTGAAAAMGALDTATFGASSALLAAGDKTGDLTEAAKEIKDRNTGAYLAGSAAGLILPGAIAKAGAKALTSAGTAAARAVPALGKVGQAVQAADAAIAGSQAVQAVGKVAGAIESTVGKVGKTAAEAAGKYANVAQKSAEAATRGIIEGTAYGLGAGISEASLGKPEDVVDHLISNTMFGALTGGAFGAAIGAAPSAIGAMKDLAKTGVGKARSAVDTAAQKSLQAAAVMSAKAKGLSDDLVKTLSDSFKDDSLVQSAMKLHNEGRIQEFNKFVKDTERKLRLATTKEAKDLTRALNTSLSAADDSAKTYIQQTVQSSGDDIFQALKTIEGDVKTAYSYFDDALAKADPYIGGARINGPELASRIDKTVDYLRTAAPQNLATRRALQNADELVDISAKLRSTGMSAAEETAVLARAKQLLPTKVADDVVQSLNKDITSAIDSVIVKSAPEKVMQSWDKQIKGLLDSSDGEIKSLGSQLRSQLNVLKAAGSEAEQFAALRQLKQSATDAVYNGKLAREGKNAVAKLNKDLTGYLRLHPNRALADQLLSADTYYSSYKVLQNGLANRSGIKRGAVNRLFNDPTASDRLVPALNNFADFMPEVKNVLDNMGNVKNLKAARERLRDEMNRRLLLSDTGKLGVDDIEDLFNIIGMTKKSASNIDKLNKVSKVLKETADMTVPDRLVALAEAAGDTASVARVREMMPHSELMEKIEKLRSIGKGADAGGTGKLATYGTAGWVLGPKGIVMAKAADEAMKIAASPWTAYETYKAVQKFSRNGQTIFNAVADHTANALIKGGTAAAKAAMPVTVMSSSLTDMPRDKKVAKYRDIQSKLQEMSPTQLAETVDKNLNHASDIPNIKGALTTRMTQTAQYLTETAPKDPTEGLGAVMGDSDWEPSDQELNAYLRRVDAVDNPLRAMAKIADGTITPEEIQTLQAIHPGLFNGLKEKVISGIMESKEKIPYKSKLLINSVFGVPMDYSVSPDFVSKMQGTYTPVDKGGRPESAATRKKNLNINPLDQLTETARISYGRGK